MGVFQDYLNYDSNNEYIEKQLKILDKITLSQDNINKIKGINKKLNIILVAQVYCPDCRAIVPFIKKFSEINENINVTYETRDSSKNILKNGLKADRIPTIFYDNGIEQRVLLMEFPKVVLNAFESNPTDYDNIKYNFRTGKFNSEIENELVNMFISL